MSLLQLLIILRARYKVILVYMFGVAALALLLSLVLPNRYTAETTVVVDMSVPDPVAGFVLGGNPMVNYMPTQIDIIKSDHVAQKVVKALGLVRVAELNDEWLADTDGRGDKIEWLATGLAKHLSVEPGKESNLITIGYKAPDANLAAAIVNAFAAAYVATNIELRAQPARDSAQWLHSQLLASRATLDRTQARISDYQRSRDLVGVDERLDAENARLADLTQQLTIVQGQSSDALSKQGLAGSSSSLPEVADEPVIVKLRGDISDAQARLADAAATLGVNHPTYIELKSHLDALRTQLAHEQNVSATGFGRSHNVGKAKQADLETLIQAQRSQLLQISQQRGQLNVLLQDEQSAEAAYQEVSRRYTQASLQSGVVQTNVSVLTEGSVPSLPSSPKPLLYTILAVFVGLIFGIFAAFSRESTDRRIRSGRDVELFVGLPLLADFKASRRRRFSRKLRGPRTPALKALAQ